MWWIIPALILFMLLVLLPKRDEEEELTEDEMLAVESDAQDMLDILFLDELEEEDDDF